MKGPKRSETLQTYGHAGGHLRDALLDALECGQDEWWKQIQIDFNHDRHNRWWQRISQRRRAAWLLGQLWNCTDILPSAYCNEITDRDPEGRHNFTYAVLARLLAEELKEVRTAA